MTILGVRSRAQITTCHYWAQRVQLMVNATWGCHRGLCGEVANEGLHIDPSTRTHSAALQSGLIHTSGSPQTLSERSRHSGTAVDYTRPRDGVEDIRSLPVPIPRWKRSQRGRAKSHWTWREWKLWQCDCLRNGWRKKAVRAAIELRNVDPANYLVDFSRVEETWGKCGVIYGLYHCTTGRWYVGQTKKRAWVRAQEHWCSRNRLPDLLHEALSSEQDPFCMALIPLEFIDETTWANVAGSHLE